MMQGLVDFIASKDFITLVALVLALISSMLACAGWASYISERKLSSKSFSPSSNGKENHSSIINNPDDNQKGCDDIG